MRTLAWIVGLILSVLILRDVFNALMVPGRMRRPFRFVPVYFKTTWRLWAAVGRRIKDEEGRERLLSIYGPLAMLCLLALWAGGLLVAFGLLQSLKRFRERGSPRLLLHKWGTDLHARHGRVNGCGDCIQSAGDH
jgi:hypothetical protein